MTARFQPERAERESRRQRGSRCIRDVFPAWFALSLLTTLPYIFAWIRTPSGSLFSGVLTAYDDTFTYFAWIQQAAGGRLLMCDLYTSEPQSCEFFLPLWVVLGFVTRVTGLPVAIVFHAARLAAALLMLIVARSIALLAFPPGAFASRTCVRLTLWLYAFGGGLGWLVYAFKSGGSLADGGVATGSADLNLPEAFAFRSSFAQVLFPLGTALVCGAIGLFFSAVLQNSWRRAAFAGIAVSLLAVVHPYSVVVAGVVALVVYLGWPWLAGKTSTKTVEGNGPPGWFAHYLDRFGVALVFAIGSLPGVAYLFYLNSTNEVLREWLRVTDTMSPEPIEYVLGVGLVGVLAAIGFAFESIRGNVVWTLLLIWTNVQAALLYAPVNFQRRLVEGLQLPITIAAAAALFWFATRLRKQHVRSVFLTAAVIIASLTNIGFTAGQMFADSRNPAAGDPRRYISGDLVDAFEWLRVNSDSDAVVFCSYLTGNILPAFSGRRVYLGHYGQTMDSGRKEEIVARFFLGQTPEEETRQLMKDNGVSFILLGPFERKISNTISIPSFARSIYRAGEVELYALEPDANEN